MDSATSSDSPLGPADYYRLVRTQIEFEASLAAQRLNWFVTAQAFLFSAYAITLNAPHESAVPRYATQQSLLFHLIPLVACATCFLVYLSVLGAIFAQVHLREFLAAHVPPEDLVPFPAIQGRSSTRLLGLAAPLGLPIVFVAVWIFIYTHGLR
jgi:hypothetical protein